MLDSVASLLVELHLAGLFWGDCSLSNLLYRWDAGMIEAVMIDGETSVLKDQLSRGQRHEDLSIMIENVAGEMADIAAEGEADIDQADMALGEDIAKRYYALWDALNEDVIIPKNETFRIRQRLDRLHAIGFAVDDFTLEPVDEGNLIRLRVSVAGRTFYGDRLHQLTGVSASEVQARVILGDLRYFRARKGATTETEKVLANMEWLNLWYEPHVQVIARTWPTEDRVQRYCDFLHYRLEMARGRGRDVDNEEAFSSWMDAGGPGIPPGAFEIDDLEGVRP